MNTASPPAAPADAWGASHRSFAVLGDTQRTTRLEALLLRREQNEAAQRALIAQLANQERPDFVVHLGDLVSAGASEREWQYFERLMLPLTRRGVEIEPVPGNHDYSGSPGLTQLRQRFPALAHRTYRLSRRAELALVFLDTNLSGSVAEEQTHWFEATLSALERDSGSRAVLVFTHHPPFTNAVLGPVWLGAAVPRSEDRYVREHILPRFCAAKKTLALLSGHVHGYERFMLRGKACIVSGGGGGPRGRYATGRAARHVPSYQTADGAPRPLHYIVVVQERDTLRFTVKFLTPPGGGCCELETFCLSLPNTR